MKWHSEKVGIYWQIKRGDELMPVRYSTERAANSAADEINSGDDLLRAMKHTTAEQIDAAFEHWWLANSWWDKRADFKSLAKAGWICGVHWRGGTEGWREFANRVLTSLRSYDGKLADHLATQAPKEDVAPKEKAAPLDPRDLPYAPPERRPL